jgi:pimeloyl-ACP methyl ester carboxylesterase
MKYFAFLLMLLAFAAEKSIAQNYTPVIEPSSCLLKIEKSLITRCGNLVVPENRQKPKGRKIKIPFIFVRKAGDDSVKNITLFTTGGPGYSTINNFDSIHPQSDILQFGGFIIFDQRGTKKAQPCLDCEEVNIAIKIAYKKNLNKDSLAQKAVQQCRNRLLAKGIDLSAYNTIESAADINDLRIALKLDSLNLLGVSYSGGLMLTVARNHPECAKTLLLNSPLPGYANYEEDGLFNINEALDKIFENCERDSLNLPQYHNLKARFRHYFTTITGKVFTIVYSEKGTSDTLHIRYGKNELLEAVVNRITNGELKNVPLVINEMIKGNHHNYITALLDGYFSGDNWISTGMRYSVYCSEQIAYADKLLIKKQEELLPWLSGYAFNNVDHSICSCWKVSPVAAIAKKPAYSNIPALLSSGDADPWCPLFYNRLIKRYMPNAQILLFRNRAHAPGFGPNGADFVKIFLENPFQKIKTGSTEVTVE